MPISLEEAWSKMDYWFRKMLDSISSGNKEEVISSYRNWEMIYNNVLTSFEKGLWEKNHENEANIIMTTAEKLPLPSYLKIKDVLLSKKEEIWRMYGGKFAAQSGYSTLKTSHGGIHQRV